MNIHWKDWCGSWSFNTWPPDVKSWLIEKDPDVGKGWRQKKGAAEDEMIRYHHQLSGHEFEQTLGDSEGQEAWHALVHVVTNNWTQLSDWTTTTTKSKVSLGYKQLVSECPFNVLKVRMHSKPLTHKHFHLRIICLWYGYFIKSWL